MWLGCPKSKIITELANSPIGFGISGMLFPFLGPWGKMVDRQVEKLNILPSSVFSQGSKAILVFGGQSGALSRSASLGGGYGYVELVRGQPPRRLREHVRDIQNPIEMIPLPSDFLFEFDHSDIQANARTAGALLEVANRIRAKSPTHLTVVGYTDSVGDFGYNLALSKARADTVAGILVGFGLAQPSQITTTGYGSLHPVADNTSDAGRARNRRVEIRLY